MYSGTDERRAEGENSSPVVTILLYMVRILSWEVREIQIRDKSMPIRHHYRTLLYLSVKCACVYVSFGVNRSFSTTWLTISAARCGTTGHYRRSMLDWHGQVRNYGQHMEHSLNEQPNRIWLENRRVANFHIACLTFVSFLRDRLSVSDLIN